MLAPRTLPSEYAAWNRCHRAPSGPDWWVRLLTSRLYGRFAYRFPLGGVAWRYRMHLPRGVIRRIGPFGFQANSRTREFEYPWCFFVTPLVPGMRVLEVGAGASGFQFVLASLGLSVTSVDPILNPSSSVNWAFSAAEFQRLNRVFGGRIRFVHEALEHARLDANTYDRVMSISAIEHFAPSAIGPLVHEVRRVLRPGGVFIMTIDLFLDCRPFTSAPRNDYGANISVRDLVEKSGLRLKVGDRSQLHGYPDFDAEDLMRRKDEFLVVGNVMTQCLVLEKPA